MDIHELAEAGGVINYHTHAMLVDGDRSLAHIAGSAQFKGRLQVGDLPMVMSRVVVGAECVLGDHVQLEHQVWLDDAVTIGDHAKLHANVVVFRNGAVQDKAIIHEHSVVGPGVIVPYEAQIGAGMVIPTNDAIKVLGRMGNSNRIMTIHGSDDGPRFSTGCQYSDDWEMIKYRIQHAVETDPSSAKRYREYLTVIRRMGELAQRHYEAEATLVADLKGKAAEISARQQYR